ncbi:hypothetical protein U9M48_018650 [Paspalum notatum var. saurae]|uniref:KIB1-4 beta-propeller domain-containing protein n=1 Tax=Paspalum notatum var. saurae TaxID=547442 RepID=A0AAQ3WQQ9_PASNO
MEQGGGKIPSTPTSTSTVSRKPPVSPRAAAALRSWGDIPDNILVCVSAFLRCRADRVHMACVNRQWWAAVRGVRRPPPPLLPPLPLLPPQLPWLIFPGTTESPTFYSPLTGRHHRLCGLPHDVRAARCCGSGDGGWLVLALNSRHAHALYNLDTSQRIPLPPGFRTPRNADFPLVVRAATLSAAPSPGVPYMVAAIVLVANGSTAAFWTEGSPSWFAPGGPPRPQDVIFYVGGFYFVGADEGVVTFYPYVAPNGDVTFARLDYEMQQRGDYNDDLGFVGNHGKMTRYLVVSQGLLLMVVRYVYDHDGGIGGTTEMIRVFRFLVTGPLADPAQPPLATWVSLGNELGGRMLFLGRGCSRCFEVARYDGFQESMIYFLDEGFVSVLSADGRRLYSFSDMGRYSMEETATEPWPPGRCPSTSDNAPPTWWLH